MTNTDILEMLKTNLGYVNVNPATRTQLTHYITFATKSIEDEGLTLSSSTIKGDIDYTEGTAEIDLEKMADKDFGVYVFSYGEAWEYKGESVDLSDYGITITGEPVEGSTITLDYYETNGITIEDGMLVVMYAEWLIRKRDTGDGMPRMLRYNLNNRVLKEKAGANNV